MLSCDALINFLGIVNNMSKYNMKNWMCILARIEKSIPSQLLDFSERRYLNQISFTRIENSKHVNLCRKSNFKFRKKWKNQLNSFSCIVSFELNLSNTKFVGSIEIKHLKIIFRTLVVECYCVKKEKKEIVNASQKNNSLVLFEMEKECKRYANYRFFFSSYAYNLVLMNVWRS